MEQEEKSNAQELKISVQMKVSYLFDFLYQHSYHGIYGVLNYGFSLLAVILLACGAGKGNAMTTAALLLLAAMFTVINPLLLYQKAIKQKNRVPAFQKPLHYSLEETGIRCCQENESVFLSWSDMVLIRETRINLILYFGAANAVIFPKAELCEQLVDVKELLKRVRPELVSQKRGLV